MSSRLVRRAMSVEVQPTELPEGRSFVIETNKRRGLEQPGAWSKRSKPSSEGSPDNATARYGVAFSEVAIPPLPPSCHRVPWLDDEVAIPSPDQRIAWTPLPDLPAARDAGLRAGTRSASEPASPLAPIVPDARLQLVVDSIQQMVPQPPKLHADVATPPETSSTSPGFPRGTPEGLAVYGDISTQIPEEIFPLAAQLQQLHVSRDCPATDGVQCECEMVRAQLWTASTVQLSDPADAVVDKLNAFHRMLMGFVGDYIATTWPAFDRRFGEGDAKQDGPPTQPSREEWVRVTRIFYLHEICQREMVHRRRLIARGARLRGFVRWSVNETLDAVWRGWLLRLTVWEAEQLVCVASYLRGVFAGFQHELDREHLHRVEDGRRRLCVGADDQGMALLHRARGSADEEELGRVLEVADRAYIWQITNQHLLNFLRTVGGHRSSMLYKDNYFRDPASGANSAWRWALGRGETRVFAGRERTADARAWGYVFMDRERLIKYRVLESPFVRAA
ncbi:uncharacterized protein BP01DRAFT_387439 [Aspergillus saccharolyticus JOP 1030-1]|uniref:Uncharacterized protein n=1 Tax=Aspergillus saccharolyticus JOP 1030-1 TaxID=1450539 RepID=A0A318ZY64_9EURO|nr:hypothetical protein BP01DRAFT_387439 [Aspergillus saccharolyticus JOP 1030-1]PYH40332.1 hypothetical protein BP01DRAFT_387439 [Aspergillus saccharolyticus JOP 1030-1]